MSKTLLKGLFGLLLFFGMWFSLSRIDWVKIFKVQERTESLEQKLGDLLWKSIEDTEEVVSDTIVTNTINNIVNKICTANNLDRENIKAHVIVSKEINAFALPNGHLVIFTGLIENAENAEEVTGVICHEIAHITKKHVMKKLIKEIGLSALISMTTGSNSTIIIQKTAKTLSSSAFDRSLEKEADLTAVEYLVNANVAVEPLANFLFRLAENESEIAEYLIWINTHPDTKDRAQYIIEYGAKKSKNPQPIIPVNTWEKLMKSIKKLNTENSKIENESF